MRAVLFALLLPGVALAQNESPAPGSPLTSSASATERSEGVRAKRATETTLVDDRDASVPEARGDVPVPEKIVEPPPPEAAPTVSIRTDDSGDVVEEYRQGGRITMVRVRPTKGPPYTLIDTNGDGQLDRKDGEGPVRPVYWTIYEWN